MNLLSMCVILMSAGCCYVSCEVQRPKGVSLAMLSLYDPNKPFRCLDGSQVIDIEYVNDDYCDCKDGSDEPGTSACSNGHFYCENKGHRSEIIPSSRVGDGICDCCDGSDEWSSAAQCQDTCFEKGRAAREEAERKRLLMSQGYKLREDYMRQGQQAKTEKQARLDEVEKEKVAAETKKNEMDELKKAAVELEKSAKDKHEAEWNEVKKQMEEAKDKLDAEKAFAELDADSDGSVSLSEVQAHLEFDGDGNGDVTLEEAKAFTNSEAPLDLAAFTETAWPTMKSVYQFVSPPPPVEAPPTESPDTDTGDLEDIGEGADDEEYGAEDDEDEEEEELEAEKPTEEQEEPSDPQMPDYDEETKKLIEAADKARADFNEAEGEFKRLDSELDELNKFLELDLGPNESFYALKGQCYDYTDREYVYTICPFDRASQKPKNGGSETNLGRWGRFDGPENDKYSIMMFDHGLKCWNGPDRSAKVFVHCGMENVLTSASEPNRCEYQLDFSTPAVCGQPTDQSTDTHDEL